MRGLLLKMSDYDANGGSASQGSPIYLEHRLVITTIMTQRRQCLTKKPNSRRILTTLLQLIMTQTAAVSYREAQIHIENNIN